MSILWLVVAFVYSQANLLWIYWLEFHYQDQARAFCFLKSVNWRKKIVSSTLIWSSDKLIAPRNLRIRVVEVMCVGELWKLDSKQTSPFLKVCQLWWKTWYLGARQAGASRLSCLKIFNTGISSFFSTLRLKSHMNKKLHKKKDVSLKKILFNFVF